jgi:hypothetical protein
MDDYLRVMADCPHVWIVLSKRPNRMLEWVGHVEEKLGHVPRNFWLCTSLVAPAAVRGRVQGMVQIRERLPGHVCGLSIEPPFADLAPQLRRGFPGLPEAMTWVKLGGGSDHGGSKAGPSPVEWLRELRDYFRRGATAVFVKQLGSHPTEAGRPLCLKDPHGADWREWPEDLRVREMPLPPLTAPGRRPADLRPPATNPRPRPLHRPPTPIPPRVQTGRALTKGRRMSGKLYEAIERAREGWKKSAGCWPGGFSLEVDAYAAGHDAGMHWAKQADWQDLRRLCWDVMGPGDVNGEWWEGDYFLRGFGRGADWVYCEKQFETALQGVAEVTRREAESN